ncbi:MAG: TIGR02466 family protein [Pseudomonadota bacterium]
MTTNKPQILSAFSTLIGTFHLRDADLVDELDTSIWMLEDGDEAGAAWCEEQGYDGYTSYASLDDLPMRTPAFSALKNKLDQFASAYADALHWNLDGQRLILDSLWVNILAPGGSHSAHLHPNSVISGTAYITLPEGSGAIKFEDPRLGFMMAAPPQREDVPETGKRFIYRSPSPGEVLMWESWLRHEVMPNRSEDPRLSVSFNYGLAADPD